MELTASGRYNLPFGGLKIVILLPYALSLAAAHLVFVRVSSRFIFTTNPVK
jgi:hypothetical protein